ncbi:MAG: hypothetical protein ABIK43_00710 [candidate division WOR-3 bacterium]
MASDVTRRLERWLLKTDPDTVNALLHRLREGMVRRQEEQQIEMYQAELKARQTLNDSNVPTVLYAMYLNYARELFSLSRRFAGSSLIREANVLLEKWVGRSLNREVLERIRDEVFNIGNPAGD